MSYADLRTMPTCPAVMLVIVGGEVSGVGIVAWLWSRFRHGVSGGGVRDEAIVDGPAVCGADSAGAGGSLGGDRTGWLQEMAGCAGVFAGVSGRDPQPAGAPELVDAGGGRRGR